MAAPEFVPSPIGATSHYESPPQRFRSWTAQRPGDTVGRPHPNVDALGSPGPDQGYALALTELFDSKLKLVDGEHRADVDAGCVEVALKRASLFGRAPVVHDLRIAYTIFGFLDAHAPVELIAHRKMMFAEVHYSFHYFERRAIADSVPDDVLRKTPDGVASLYADDWRACITFGR